jgi:SAM-dependent methyltransferase
MGKIFIDENIKILTGEEADKALKLENDKEYYDPEKGVVRVSLERWKKAQTCEKNHWFVRGIKHGNDRNDYHFKQFDGYKDIKNKQFEQVLEIGCGPFTNLRFIGKVCNINYCTLLDPMVLDYLNHPFCSYNKDFLFSEYSPLIGKVIIKFLPQTFKLYRSLLTKKIKINKLLNIPSENIPSSIYDLVVMINVIEHCFDIELVFSNILNITKSGSFFVFEDKLFEEDEINNSLENSYDAAHPLKVGRKLIFSFLTDNFQTVYKRIQTNSNYFGGEYHYSDDLYFIGKRK